MPAQTLEQVANLAKRRGFIVQSSEIYGGAAAAYDYGPPGVEMKRAVASLWWEAMTREPNIVGLDAAILMHPKVWEASGHLASFSDLLVECRRCNRRFREQETGNPEPAKGKPAPVCPHCGEKGTLTAPREFNLMFETHLGPTAKGPPVFLRPETAQGIYVDAPYLREVMRLKLPFGIAQIGKAFRNEITPGPFTYRTVEFEQMEMQYFVRPSEAQAAYAAWQEKRRSWYASVLGFPPDTIRRVDHPPEKLAHYARAACDLEFRFPFGWGEVEGIHNRGDWDLSRHQKYSRKDLTIFDDATQAKVLPWIVETSAGLDRLVLAILCEAYAEEVVATPGAAGRGAGETRTVLRLPPVVAPVTAAVLPLLSNDAALVREASAIAAELRGRGRIQYDDAGAIGRRYRRQDEIGTPRCVTVDHQTLRDGTVTVRDRDTTTQERVARGSLPAALGLA